MIIAALRQTNSQDYSPAVIARVEVSYSPEAVARLLTCRQVLVARVAGVQTLRVPSSLTAQALYARLGYAVVREVVEGEERTLVMAKVLIR